MNNHRILLLLLTALCLKLSAQAWDFADEIDSPRLFLHPFITYASSVDDDVAWEENQFARTQFRMNVGSVSLNRLNTDVEARLNHDLDDLFTFRAQYLRQSFQHDPEDYETCSMEMEWRLFENTAVFAGANPEFDKEDVDIVAGVMLSDTTRTRYARLTIVYEDFVYDEKNEANARTTREPFGIRWEVRPGFGLYTEGYLTEGFQREFQPADSVGVLLHEGFERYALARYTIPRISFDARFDEFFDEKMFADSSRTHRMTMFQVGVRASMDLFEKIQFRPHLRMVWAKLDDDPKCWFRSEILYALLFAYDSAIGEWETGYMAGEREIRDTSVPFMPEDYTHEDKVYLGWNWYFKKNAHLKLSVSHEPSIDGFGGANMQFRMVY